LYLKPRVCEHMSGRSTLGRVKLKHGDEEVCERCSNFSKVRALVYPLYKATM
jgi:hypothetical protein